MVKKNTKQTKAQLATHSSPLEIVLQWLTYVFWGLLLASLILLVVTLAHLVIRNQVLHDIVPYTIAATLVLLPMAIVTDWLYRRREPAKKAGMAAVVMVVHAVIFALIAIGTLVGAVFTGVAWLLETSQDTTVHQVSLVSLVVAALLFTLLFVRVISPRRPMWLAATFAAVMSVVALALLAWGMLGPVAQFVERSDDRRIVDFAPAVYEGVDRYIHDNQKLPDSLNDLDDLPADAEALIEDDLVTYKKGDVVENSELGERQYRFELCATYQYASSKNARDETVGMYGGLGGYQGYLFIPGHPAGEVCYRLQTVIYA